MSYSLQCQQPRFQTDVDRPLVNHPTIVSGLRDDRRGGWWMLTRNLAGTIASGQIIQEQMTSTSRHRQNNPDQGTTGWQNIGLLCLLVASISTTAIHGTMAQAQTIPTTEQDRRDSIAQATTASRRTLRVGNQGEDVRELQAALKLLGYFTGTIDGVFGSQTEAAVRRFQTAAGTTPDGIVGVVTWASLFPSADTFTRNSASNPTSPPANPSSEPDYPILRRGARGDAVIRLQQRLQARGFLQGTADGVFGVETETAVKAAQRRYGLTPDGVAGPATWEALLR